MRSKTLTITGALLGASLVVGGIFYFNHTEEEIQSALTTPTASTSGSPSASGNGVNSVANGDSTGTPTAGSNSTDIPNLPPGAVITSQDPTPQNSGAGESLKIVNLPKPGDSVPSVEGTPEANYEKGKELRNSGDITAAIAYFTNARNSQDFNVSTRSSTNLAQLQSIVENPDVFLAVFPDSDFTAGTRNISQDGNFTQGQYSIPVKAGDKVTVEKEPYQAYIVVTSKTGESVTYSAILK